MMPSNETIIKIGVLLKIEKRDLDENLVTVMLFQKFKGTGHFSLYGFFVEWHSRNNDRMKNKVLPIERMTILNFSS